LEDRDRSPAYWAEVRRNPARHAHTAYGSLVGTAKEVMQALHDGGTRYSVQGYGQRMAASVGDNILGMDEAARQGQMIVKQVLENVTEEEAFALTTRIVVGVLGKFPEIPRSSGDIVRKAVDLVNFSDFVLASLCSEWFGLPPDPQQAQAPLMIPGG